MQDISIQSLMTRDVMCADPVASIIEVADIMHKKQFSCIMVANGGMPVGIITERDLVRIMPKLLKNPGHQELCAAGVMSAPPITISEEATLFEALVIAQARKIRHLPVTTSQGALIGIVTYSDLIRIQQGLIEKQREIIEHAVSARTRELEEANNRLKALSLQDSLLGIGNRRAMEVDLQYTHHSSIRYGRPYSVVLFDIDNFKSYNDCYGHTEGDKTLRRVTSHLTFSIRKADRLYRYGGEELLLLLPETREDGAYVLADRLVKGLAEQKIPHSRSAHNVITVSAGIGFEEPRHLQGTDWKKLVEKADRGLYLAKNKGKNQVVACSHMVVQNFMQEPLINSCGR